MEDLLGQMRPAKLLGPSPLRNEQQIPESDTLSHETQFEADNRLPDEDFELSEAAFLGRVRAKHSKPLSPLPQNLGITKSILPIASEPWSPFVFGRGPSNKPIPSRVTGAAPEHTAIADTAIPSSEAFTNKEPINRAHMTFATSHDVKSPARTELINNSNNDQCQDLHHLRTENSNLKKTHSLDTVFSATQDVMESTTVGIVPITRKKGSTAKIKKGRKVLLPLPLRPWPPQQDSAPCGSGSTSRESTVEYGEQISGPDLDSGDFAVKKQPEEASELIDEHCNDEQRPLVIIADGFKGAQVDSRTTSRDQVEEVADLGRNLPVQHRASSVTVETQPVLTASSSDGPNDHSSRVSYEDCGPLMSKKAPVRLFTRLKTTEESLGKLQASPDSDAATGQQNRNHTGPWLLSYDSEALLRPGTDHTTRSVDVQETLRRASERAGTIRVKKSSKNPHTAYEVQPRPVAGAGANERSPKMTAIEKAFVSIRDAYLADQSRVEECMNATVMKLEDDKVQLHSTITEQSTEIDELRGKLQKAEASLKSLEGKAVSTLKYVSGFQTDHENSRKQLASFREQIKDLQEQIANLIEERNVLKGDLDKILESSVRSHKAMRSTMQETYLRYALASSSKHELQHQLNERTSMHDEEKCKRIELETQILPSVQSMKQQLSENSTTIVDKLDNLHTELADRATESNTNRNVEECLLILQKFSSLPLLTANDVRKAEGMLRSLHERDNSCLQLLAKSAEVNTVSTEVFRQMLQDQTQGLQLQFLQHEQATLNSNQAQEANRLLKLELESQTRDHQNLKEQMVMLIDSEETLKVRVAELEKETSDLQLSLRDHQDQSQESKLNKEQLQEQLSQFRTNLQASHETIKQHERLSLEGKREFSKHRNETARLLNRLKDHLNEASNEARARECEYIASKQLEKNLKASLKSAESRIDELTLEVAQHKSEVETYRQEHHSMMEKEGRTRALLESAEETNMAIEEEKRLLRTELDSYRMSLQELKCGEEVLCAERDDLQRQLAELQSLARIKESQLQQAEFDLGNRLQQTQDEHAVKLADLQYRFDLSESSRRESQAKLRQTREAQKHQLGCHEQKCHERFDQLAAEAAQELEKVKAEHLREMERYRKKANAGTLAIQKMYTPLKAISPEKSEVQVPNTQRSSQSDDLPEPSQQMQTGRARKKINRRTSSIMDGSDLRDPSPKTSHRESADVGRVSSDNLMGHLDEEDDNQYGCEETQHTVLDPKADVVHETQEIECAQGSGTNLEVIAPVTDQSAQDDPTTELSNMPSDDLSEMLLDFESSSEQTEADSRQLPSSCAAVQTPVRSRRNNASDTTSTNSIDRPRSRANTASRMAPIPSQVVPRQYVQPDGRVEDTTSVHIRRRLDADHTGKKPHDSHSDHKRKPVGSIDGNGSFKKLRASARSQAQRPLPTSKSHAPCTPDVDTRSNLQASSSHATSRRRLGSRQTPASGFHTGSPRLSSTRNTRSKTNRYSDRFGHELDRL